MSWGLTAIGVGVIGNVIAADAQESAANTAAAAQTAASQAGIAEQQRQFDAIRKLLDPYVNAGTGSLQAQQNLIGLGGRDAQAQAIQQLQNSPEYQALSKSGQEAILANASATGGLRGGNVQSALAQFQPQLLSGLINQQYSRLGGLTSLGQNAAAGVGNAGMNTGNNIANLYGQQGAAQAGAALAGGNAQAGLYNSLGQLGGFALNRFGGFGASPYTSPGAFGGYSNPVGELSNFRGADLPNVLRGGG